MTVDLFVEQSRGQRKGHHHESVDLSPIAVCQKAASRLPVLIETYFCSNDFYHFFFSRLFMILMTSYSYRDVHGILIATTTVWKMSAERVSVKTTAHLGFTVWKSTDNVQLQESDFDSRTLRVIISTIKEKLICEIFIEATDFGKWHRFKRLGFLCHHHD